MNEGLRTCGRPSRGRYVTGCRCYMCRVANADYARENAHAGMVDMVGEAETEEARERVRSWQRDGIGLRTISAYTGVPRSALQTLVSGNHPNCNGLPKRMKRENHDAIMAARPRKRGRWTSPPMVGPALSDWEWAEAERMWMLAELPRTKIAERYHVDAATMRSHMDGRGIGYGGRRTA